jgi:hypothetical protein
MLPHNCAIANLSNQHLSQQHRYHVLKLSVNRVSTTFSHESWIIVGLCGNIKPYSDYLLLVLATGPGNPQEVRVWTAKTGWLGSRPGQKPHTITIGGTNPDPHRSTHRFHRVWLDLSVPIAGSAFRVSHLLSQSEMLLWIIRYWHWYCTLHFPRISRLDVHKKHTHMPNLILKMSINRASMIFSLASLVIWVELDHKHP